MVLQTHLREHWTLMERLWTVTLHLWTLTQRLSNSAQKTPHGAFCKPYGFGDTRGGFAFAHVLLRFEVLLPQAQCFGLFLSIRLLTFAGSLTHEVYDATPHGRRHKLG